MELVDQYEAIVLALKDLARELRIRSVTKLLQVARGRVPGANSPLVVLALEDSVSKQVLAPAYRSTGKSTAEGPDAILQTDLLEFSQNTRNAKEKYASMLADVYTREARAVPILNKKPETVNAAMQGLLSTLVGDKKSFEISSDLGREFSKLAGGGIPAEAVHREKKGNNDLAIVDRMMQTIKTDQVAIVSDGVAKNWVDSLLIAISAYNNRPHSAVFGAPATASRPEQDFKIRQSNARKFSLNRGAQLNKSKSLKEAGAFRAPLPSKRSFEPRYGEVQLLAKPRKDDGNDVVRNRSGGTFVLKEIQPVVPNSGKIAGRLIEKSLPRKIRLQERAGEIEEHIREVGGQMSVSDLERAIRRGVAWVVQGIQT